MNDSERADEAAQSALGVLIPAGAGYFHCSAGSSDYVLPSRYDSDAPMSAATINQVLTLAYKAAQKDGKSLARFGPHDLRRTASTLLHEAGYNTDWIEKCLAHEQRGVRAVHNKAEYREQRAAMLQDWADMIDEWTAVDNC